MYVLVSTLLATVSAFIIYQLSKESQGSGIPEIKAILGGYIMEGFLSSKNLIAKAASLPLSIASGLSIGKEGSMITLACCIGHSIPQQMSKVTKNPWVSERKKREIMSASAAAGMGVAFGAPIGGVLFSLEELSSFFSAKTMLKSFFCTLIATVSLQMIDPYRGKRVLYQMSYSRDWNFFELIFFVLLGIFGGLSGALFIRLNLKIRRLKRMNRWWDSHPIIEVMVLVLLTAFVSYLNPFTKLDNTELLGYLFRECEEGNFGGLCDYEQGLVTSVSLLIALIINFLLTVLTFGVSVPGGIFIPAMVWGALFGRNLGVLARFLQKNTPGYFLFSVCHPEKECINPGMYALLGAMSALCGVTKMTVSSTVIMFELTGTLNYIIPTMVTLTISKWVGDVLVRGGFSDILIRFYQYPYLDPKNDEVYGISIRTAMVHRSQLCCLFAKMKLTDIEHILMSTQYHGYPVVESESDPALLGYILTGDIEKLLAEALLKPNADQLTVWFGRRRSRPSPIESPLRQRFISSQEEDWGRYMDAHPVTVHSRMTFDFVVDIFRKLGPRLVLVTDNDRLMGMVTKKDLLQYIRGEDPDSDGYLLHGRMDTNQMSHAPLFRSLFSTHDPIPQDISMEDLAEIRQ